VSSDGFCCATVPRHMVADWRATRRTGWAPTRPPNRWFQAEHAHDFSARRRFTIRPFGTQVPVHRTSFSATATNC
jgi:hypothetical protein